MNLHIPQGVLPKFSFGGINKFNSHITLIRLFNRTGFCSSALFVVVLGLLFFPLAHKLNTTEAATFDPAEPTLTLSASNVALSFKVDDPNGTFTASTPSNIQVSTNNYTGYTLSMAASDINNVTNTANTAETYTKLVNTLDNSQVLTSISSPSTEQEFNAGNWGYLINKISGTITENTIDNTKYQPAPTKAGTTLDVTDRANNEANNYSVTLGVKANYNTKVGTYANSYVLTAVANPVGYTITYDKNTEDDVTNMPAQQIGTLGDANVILSNKTPVNSNDVEFLGWCTEIPSGNSCPGTTYQPGDIIDLSQLVNNNITLYAKWYAMGISDLTYMQDFADLSDEDKTDVIASMTADQAYQLKDSRDDKTYNITKLSADGKIWMTQNLNLAGGTVIESTKSNVPEGYTLPTSAGFQEGNKLPASTTAGFMDYTDALAFVYNDSTYGGYYSYVAVTAGTNPSSGNATSDICPKGWRLPTRDEYNTLKTNYTTGATLTAAPWYGAYGGVHLDSSAVEWAGTFGGYWSSTVSDEEGYAYILSFGSSGADMYDYPKYYWYSARCLAKNPDVTITYDANGGTGEMASQTFIEGASGKINTNAFTRDGYTFDSWNTKADGSGTEYSAYSTYSGPSITLYAQWAHDVTITFDANGGTGTMPDQILQVHYSSNFNDNTFTRDGYTFAGWNTKADGSGDSYVGRALLKSIDSGGEYYMEEIYIPNSILDKIDADYSITLYAQWAHDVTITFDANGGTGTMPNQAVKYPGANINTNAFTRNGYVFAGWNTKADGSGDLFGSEIRFDKFDTDSITLYAQWTATSIQSITTATCPTVATVVYDTRDNAVYHVQKLADGRCWMLDNLALDLTNSTVLNGLSASNTNATVTSLGYLKNGGGTDDDQYATGGASSWGWFGEYDEPWVQMLYKNVKPDNAPSNGKGYNKVGGLYNFCAASAGSYCYSTSPENINATEDICPAGWRMPTGNTTGEYSALANAIYGSVNNTEDATAIANYRDALSLPLSGTTSEGPVENLDDYGYFWSSTRDAYNDMYSLRVSTGYVYPAYSYHRDFGLSVRCIAR